MKKVNSSLLAILLMSVGFAAAANGPHSMSPRQHMDNHPNVVYSVTQQTATPNETLKKLVNDAPETKDGKRYMVKVTIVEVPEFNRDSKNPTRGSRHANAPITAPAPAATPAQ